MSFLNTIADCAHDFLERFDSLEVRRYLNGMAFEIGEHMMEATSELSSYVQIGKWKRGSRMKL
jgi:hypothetical protein